MKEFNGEWKLKKERKKERNICKRKEEIFVKERKKEKKKERKKEKKKERMRNEVNERKKVISSQDLIVLFICLSIHLSKYDYSNFY